MTGNARVTSSAEPGADFGAQERPIPTERPTPTGGPFYEVLTAEELAARLRVPVTWVRQQVRTRAADPIPHFRLGRYVRFAWGSPELARWWERRKARR